MNKDVIISIKGTESLIDDNDSDNIELVTEGQYYKKGNKHYLSYAESEEMTGYDHTQTTLKIDGDTVSLTRFGNVNSHMVFKEGKKHIGHYETPYGSFTVGIMSDSVNVDIGERSANIRIKYMLEIDNSAKALHDLQLSIREA